MNIAENMTFAVRFEADQQKKIKFLLRNKLSPFFAFTKISEMNSTIDKT